MSYLPGYIKVMSVKDARGLLPFNGSYANLFTKINIRPVLNEDLYEFFSKLPFKPRDGALFFL